MFLFCLAFHWESEKYRYMQTIIQRPLRMYFTSWYKFLFVVIISYGGELSIEVVLPTCCVFIYFYWKMLPTPLKSFYQLIYCFWTIQLNLLLISEKFTEQLEQICTCCLNNSLDLGIFLSNKLFTRYIISFSYQNMRMCIFKVSDNSENAFLCHINLELINLFDIVVITTTSTTTTSVSVTRTPVQIVFPLDVDGINISDVNFQEGIRKEVRRSVFEDVLRWLKMDRICFDLWHWIITIAFHISFLFESVQRQEW